MNTLLINEAPLQVLPSLAKAIGLNEALILQQIHYWLNPKHNQNHFDGRYWVYNTYEQLQAQFPFWCPRTIRSTMGKLQESGLIITFVKQNDFRKSKHYTINYTVLDKIQTTATAKTAETSASIPLPDWASDEEEEKKEEEDQGEEDFHDMINVWNEAFQCEHGQSQTRLSLFQPAYLTPRREVALEAMQRFLTSRGISWRHYCNKITNTRFLMGDNPSGFKVTLDWALNIANAVKILEDAIYDKPLQQPPTQQTSNQPIESSNHSNWDRLAEEIKAYLPASVYSQEWLGACQYLAKNLGEVVFKAWFLKVGLISITTDASGDTAILQVDSNFKRDYLYNHFQDQIEAALRSVRPSIKHIKFQVVWPQNSTTH